MTGNLLLTKPTFGNFAAITSNQLNRFHAIFCLPNKDFGNFATTIPIQLNRFHVISCSLSQDIGSTESFSCNFLPIKPRFRRFRRYSSNPTESFSRNFCTMKYEWNKTSSKMFYFLHKRYEPDLFCEVWAQFSVARLRDLSPIPRFSGVSWRWQFCKNRTRFLRKFPRFWKISKFWQFFRDFQLKVGNFCDFWAFFGILKITIFLVFSNFQHEAFWKFFLKKNLKFFTIFNFLETLSHKNALKKVTQGKNWPKCVQNVAIFPRFQALQLAILAIF